MEKTPYDIIKRPLLTEKSTKAKDKLNTYMFEVAMDSNKHEIKRSIEVIFPTVKVADVRTMIMKGKPKKLRYAVNHQPNWKKAVVTLKEGSRIDTI